MREDRTEKLVREAAEALGTEPEQLTATISKFVKERNELEKEAATLEKQLR